MNHSKLKIMPSEIVTTDHLREFKIEWMFELRKMLKEAHSPSEKKWLKSCEVKKMLGISTGTLQNLRINGTLPFTKVRGTLFYDFEDIRKLMEANKTELRLNLDSRQ
jgi:hypothetical protein